MAIGSVVAPKSSNIIENYLKEANKKNKQNDIVAQQTKEALKGKAKKIAGNEQQTSALQAQSTPSPAKVENVQKPVETPPSVAAYNASGAQQPAKTQTGAQISKII
jgi:hypothetical protein